SRPCRLLRTHPPLLGRQFSRPGLPSFKPAEPTQRHRRRILRVYLCHNKHQSAKALAPFEAISLKSPPAEKKFYPTSKLSAGVNNILPSNFHHDGTLGQSDFARNPEGEFKSPHRGADTG